MHGVNWRRIVRSPFSTGGGVMGLIHSRAAKKRNRAEAALLREETRQLRGPRKAAEREAAAEAAGDSLWRQPTVGDVLKAAKRRREAR